MNEYIQRAQQNTSRPRMIGLQKQSHGRFTRKYVYPAKTHPWNYRELADNEIVLDIDYDAVPKKDVHEIVNELCYVFKCEKVAYELYDSGGKGYHFHIFYDELKAYTPEERALLRRYFFLIYGHGIAVDYAKKDENTMIGIEFQRHRNGNQKKLIDHINNGQNDKLPELVKARLRLRDLQRKVIFIQKQSDSPNDYVKTTVQGYNQNMPCMQEVLRSTKEYVTNRHYTALMLMSYLKKQKQLPQHEIIQRVQNYMDMVGYTDKRASYLYNHALGSVSCSMVQDLLMATGATHKCKSCHRNPEYKKIIQ